MTTHFIPNLSGKVIVLTGGTSGLGAEIIKLLAAHNPSQIVFTGRNVGAANALIGSLKTLYPEVRFLFISCNLSSLQSVQEASNRIAAKVSRIDYLYLNAGVMVIPPGLSKDGYEIQFATNHLGHAFMLEALLPVLEETAARPRSDVRIIITTSQAAAPPFPPKGGIRFSLLKTEQNMLFGPWARYGQSKLANLLYARAVNKRYPWITTVSVHPGIGYTGLQRGMKAFDRFVMWITTIGRRSSAQQLAWNGVWAATAPKGKGKGQVEGGVYYEPVGVRPALVGEQGNVKLEDQLWEWTQEELQAWRANQVKGSK